MIKLDDIEITEMAHDDGSREYRAKLELRVYQRMLPDVVEAITDFPAIEAHVKEHMVAQIMHSVYGDLHDSVFKLIHEAKHIADPRYPMADLQVAIQRVEALLK